MSFLPIQQNLLPGPYRLGPSSSLLYKPAHPKLSVMIRDAILAGKKKAGMSPLRIALAIESKYRDQLPVNFRKILFLKLRKLAATGRLAKTKNKFFPKPSFLKQPALIPRLVNPPLGSSPLGYSSGPVPTIQRRPEMSIPHLVSAPRFRKRSRGRALRIRARGAPAKKPKTRKSKPRSKSKSKTKKTRTTSKRRPRSRSSNGGSKRGLGRPSKRRR